MKSRNLILLLAVLILGIGTSTSNLFAQGTDLGTIRGTVTDSSGALVPNALIEIMDLANLTVHRATTNDHGDYQVPALPGGTYKATIKATGFGTAIIEHIVLTGSDVVGANAVLRAAASTTVEVSAEASLINTQDQSLSQTLSSRAVIDIPRDSRDIYSFLYINPNITQSDEPGDFKFIGAQSYGASFSVDGQRSNGGIFGQQTQTQPTLEAVSDLNVLSDTFSAEYAGVANIRVTTKRGGAGYHGSIFYNNKNSALAAWTLADKATLNAFAPTVFQPTFNKPFFNITDVGGSVGGPIPKLKNTWFFMAYEHNWTIEPSTASSTSMPHPSLLAGDFSLLNDTAKPAVGSAVLTPDEILTDTVTTPDGTMRFIKIPQRLLNPSTAKLIDLYYPKIGLSAPINPSNGRIPSYSNSVPGHASQDMGTLRIDHDFNDANHIYGVYHASAQNQALNQVVAPFTGLGLSQTDRLNNSVSLSYSHVFSPNIVNEVRGGFNKQHLFTHSNTTLEGFLSSIGFSANDIAAYGAVVGPQELTTYGHMAVSFGKGFQAFSNGGRNTDRPMDQDLITFGDTFTWQLGRHSIKVGADFVYNQAVDGFAVNRGSPRGGITYTGSGPTALASFLQGLAPATATYVNEPRPPMSVSNWETGSFIQDDFRVTPRLTLNLGMRYELFTPFTDKNDLIANFDPNYHNSSTGQDGRFVIPSTKTLKYLDPNIIKFGYVLASDSGLGVGRGLIRTDKTGFGPRLGLAFQLTPKSVLRGGYGLYYPTSAAQGIRDPIATNPFNNARTTKNITGSWPTGGETAGTSPITGGTLNPFGNTPTANYVPVDLKNPRTQQWNATFEQQIPWQSSLRFSYIGAMQTGQIVGQDLSMIQPNDNPFGTTIGDGVTPCDPTGNINPDNTCAYSPADNARLRFPALGDYILGYGNVGHSFTSSFQAQAQRQTNGFTFSLAYTYLDQNSSGLDVGNTSLGGAAYNPFQINSDYGPESYTSRQRVVAYGIFDLPMGRGKHFLSSSSRLMDALVGGWQASTNFFVKSGTPFTPFWTCDECDPVLPGNVASGSIDAVGDFNGPSFRPVLTGSPKSTAAGYQWNANAFGLPSVGSDLYTQAGVVKRNALMGPGTYGVNLGLHKSIHINDRIAMQLGADIDNVFNHPMLSPDANDGGGGGSFAQLGDFNIAVDQTTPPAPGQQPRVLPIDPNPNNGNLNINTDFGRLYRSYEQEGVDSRRSIRLRGRLTF
jgi:Carboxypeptidase regulatory-like domain